MKKRFTKSLVAMIALIAMLTQNAYSVYALADGAEQPAQVEENAPEIVVETQETPVETQEMAPDSEYVEEGTSESVDETVTEEPTSDVNYDDQIMLLDETEESVPESIDVFDSQISGSGLDSIEVYIDTNRLNTGDTFRIIFTGAADARYDTRLNDNLDTTSQGTYRFLDLNKEGFNIRATSDDNVTFEFGYTDGIPSIKAISVDTSADKMLYTKSITTKSGKPATAIFGEGYTNIAIKLDTAKLSPKAEYTVFVDTVANVSINGTQTTSVNGTKETSVIELSNLDKEQFTVYIVEKEGSEITSDASVESVEDGNATIYAIGEETRTKRVYTYSDSDVTVTATLQYANAVPDDAEFVVTPVTSKSAVNAYINALNNSDDGLVYTEDNTLLYDIAFLVDKTDEDGNVISGEKVEFEPEIGSVTIDIKFNNSQLTEELGVADSDSIIVNHLPLKDSVKDDVDTTLEATNISASDVIVEAVNADVNVVENGTDEIKLSVDSLSVFGVTGGTAITPGTSVTYDSVLGKAKNYGIVANEMTLAGHLESNFAVGSMHGNADVQGPKNEGKSAGTTYIGAYDGTNFKMTTNGNSGILLINTTYDAVNNFGFNMTHYNVGEYPRTNASPQYPSNVVVTVDKYSETEIKNIVSGIINEVKSNSEALMGEETAIAFSSSAITYNGANYPVLDIAGNNSTAGTYYLNFKKGEYTGQHFVIKINSDQNVVFNIPDTSVSFGQYEIYIDGTQYTTNGSSSEDAVCQRVIFNCPNATYAAADGNCAGTFIVPKADFYTNATSAGWLVCNNAKKIGGSEWHCVFHDLPDPIVNPTSLQLKVEKTLMNLADGDEKEPFKFVLYETENQYYTDSSHTHTKLGEATVAAYDSNNTGVSCFPEISYSQEGTYYYVIKEEMVDNQSVNWIADKGIWAHIKVVVSKKTENNVTSYVVDSVQYSFGLNKRELDNPVSLDKNNAKVPFVNTKHKVKTGLELPVTKKLTDSNDVEIPTWPIDETFYFKIEPMTNDEANPDKNNIQNHVTENPPMPIQQIVSVNNANKEAKFIWAENAFEYAETTTPGVGGVQTIVGADGVTTWKYPMCYMYKVYEVIPENKTPGVTYDEHVQYVKVWANSCKNSVGERWMEISVNGSKSLHYCEGTLNRIDFVNKYEAPKGAIKVTKSVKAGNVDYATNEKFYFIVKNGENQVGGVHEITANQTVTISDLDLGVYTVIETDVNGNPVAKSDSFKYESTVTPASVGVTANQTADTIPLTTITNRIDVDSTTITIDAVKRVNVSQYTLNNGDFEFTLKALTTGAPMPAGASNGVITKVNNGSKVNFGTITYSKDDIGHTYEYEVKESKINKNGFAANTETYKVVVVVSQSGNKVVATKTIYKGTEDKTNEGISFTNTFTAEKPFEFSAKKTITGRNLSSEEFTFVLEGLNDNAKAKMPQGSVNGKLTKKNQASNTAEEIINFGSVSFTQNDLGKEFQYKITEQGVNANGLVCDTTVYTITITPSLDSNNNLVLTKNATKTGTSTDASGYLNGDSICVLFNNTYSAGGKISFKFDKTVEGNMPSNAQFTFQLYKKADASATTGTIIGETTVTGPFPKAVVFEDLQALEFSTADIGHTYYYYTVEVIPDAAKNNSNKLNGIEYSTVVHNFSVAVSDGGNGQLAFAITKDGKSVELGDTIGTFNNKYTTVPVSVPISGIKRLPGKTIAANDYEFAIEAVSAVDSSNTAIARNDIPVPASLTTKVQDAAGNFTFGNIEFTKAGTYVYKVTEVSGSIAGVTYDNHEYIVTIKIKDNNLGQLVQDGNTEVKRITLATADTERQEEEIASLEILNTYEADGTAVITAKKVVNGTDAATEGKFVFGLYTDTLGTKLINPETGKPYVAFNDASGNVTFDEIKYKLSDLPESKTRDYTYYVHELCTQEELKTVATDKQLSILSGYTYDNGYYPVKVTVTDNGSGTLQVTKDYSGNENNEIKVKNRYEASGKTRLYGVKLLSGRDFKDDDVFVFTLIGNTTGDPNLPASGNTVDTVTVSGSDARDKAINFNFKELSYTQTGTYSYTIKELVPTNKDNNMVYDTTTIYNVTVTVTDNGDGTLNAVPDKALETSRVQFLNKVPTPDKVDFVAYKMITGRALKAGEFEFTLKEVDSSLNPVTTRSNDPRNQKKENIAAAAGTSVAVPFDGISYTMEDVGTHTYEIAEVIPSGAKPVEMVINGQTVNKYVYKGVTYDDTKYYAVVTVSVDSATNTVTHTGPYYYKNSPSGTPVTGQEPVKFENKYAGEVKAHFEGVKKLYLGEIKDGILGIGSTEIDIPAGLSFEFTLKDVNGNVLETVRNDGSSFTFSEITYTAEDFEKAGTIKIDDNHYMIKYTIEEKYAGQKINGVKYDNKIYDAAVILSVGNNGNLNATKAVKERTATDTTTDGIINKLKAFVTGNEDLIVFNNIYYAETEIKIAATKSLEGMAWGDATSFDFSIAEGTNILSQTINGGKEYITVNKDSENHVGYFDNIKYTVNDLYGVGRNGSRTYTYSVKEVIPASADRIPGVEYSDKEYIVTVTVSDNHDGTLNVSATAAVADSDDGSKTVTLTAGDDDVLVFNPNALVFTNKYKPEGTTAKIGGKKVLVNKTLGEGEFSFTIERVTADAPLPAETTVSNKADSTFEFGEMTFTPEMMLGSDGIYLSSRQFEYTVTEVVPDDAETVTVNGKTYKKKGNITYDITPKTVIVTVTNTAGKLSASVSPDSIGLQFTNAYNNEGSTALSIRKVVDGTNATDKQFSFVLRSLTESDPNREGKSGDIIDTVVANNLETKTFAELKYTLQKTIDDAKAQGSTTNTAVYVYEVSEVQDPVAGYEISKQVYTATISVVANADGTLTIAPVIVETTDEDGAPTGYTAEQSVNVAEFNNSYEAEGFTEVPLTKVLKGRDIKAGEFTFYLKNEAGDKLETRTSSASVLQADKTAKNSYVFGGNGSESKLKYTNADLIDDGVYKSDKVLYYTIEEDIPGDAETVKIDGKNYKKKGCVIYDNAVYVVAVFINNPGEGSLSVDRVFGRFEQSRTEAISSMKDLVAAKWDASKSFADNVKDIKKDGTFAENITFNNEYEANGKWDPRGKKVLTGLPLKEDKMFYFTLSEYEVKDGKATSKVINKAEGYNGGENHEQIIFDESNVGFLKYDLDDVGLHVYKITEVLPVKPDKNGNVIYNGISYDTKEWTFNVTVEDNGDGTLKVTCPEDTNTGDVAFTFNNNYEAAGFIDLYGAKVLEGCEFTDVDNFEFSIKEITPGMESGEFKVNNNNGEIAFSHEAISILNYEIKNDDRSDVTDHLYEIRETSKSGNGITCDTRVYTVTVSVTDDGEGNLNAAVTSVTYPLNDGAGTGSYDFSTGEKAPCFSFTNKYEAKAEILFKGVKHLRNAELSTEDIVNAAQLAGKYNFSIYEYKTVEDRTNGVGGKLISTTSCDGEGKYTLHGTKFTQKDLLNADQTSYADSIEVYYQIVEVKPSEGTWNEDKTIFTGANGVIYDNTVYNVDVTVKKAAKGSDKLQIEVKDHDNSNAINAVPDAENVYTIGDTDAQRAARADKIGYFDFKNIKPEKVKIEGTKTWNDGGKDPSTRPDVIIELKSDADGFTAVLDTYTIKAPATTYVFDNLPATDKYGKKITYDTFERETEELKGYFSEKSGYDFINTQGDIVIRKIAADTGLPLEGAVLAIIDGTGAEVERWTTTSSAHVVEAKLTPGATYTLREISAPSGYIVAADQTFTVPANGGSIDVTMRDERIFGNVRLRKLDSATREALSGAEFALYTEGGDRVYASGTPGSYAYSRTSSNGRFAVNSSGELLITGLPYGTYYFTELTAPSGYSLSSERLGFTVLENGTTLEVTFLNTKETGSVRLRKTNADGSVALAGAVFELYAKTPSSASAAIASTIYSGAYYRVGTYTTDASGSIYVGDLPWDDYYFVEVTAPSGYEISTDVNGDQLVYTFTVGAGGSTELTYDLGRITNPTTTTPPPGGEVRGERRDDGRRSGGVLAGVLGVRAAPKQGVLGERLGPVTGDAANMFLWLLLLLASIGAIVSVAVVNAKRKRQAR